MADVPSVVFQSYHIAHFGEADGIEMAGDRFLEVNLARTMGFLYQAVAPAVVVGAREDAVLAVDDGGNALARGVVVGNALLLHHCPRLFGHLRQKDGQNLLYLALFIGFQRRTCIALNATTAATLI